MMTKEQLMDIINECLDTIEAKKQKVTEATTEEVKEITEDTEFVEEDMYVCEECMNLAYFDEGYTYVFEGALENIKAGVIKGLEWLKDKISGLISKLTGLFSSKDEKVASEAKAKVGILKSLANKVTSLINRVKNGKEEDAKAASQESKEVNNKVVSISNWAKNIKVKPGEAKDASGKKVKVDELPPEKAV